MAALGFMAPVPTDAFRAEHVVCYQFPLVVGIITLELTLVVELDR